MSSPFLRDADGTFFVQVLITEEKGELANGKPNIVTKLGHLAVCDAHFTVKCKVCVNAKARRTIKRSTNGVEYTGKSA